ncbi:MAG: 16S rRNA (cytidine(1402)-2'-O)-methyltransferase, partial [Actinomycetota bacterium]|nr:16S rRNA (cytidine(1402)-2'-O)-methyltransferase [Actinomycetota bacterium]
GVRGEVTVVVGGAPQQPSTPVDLPVLVERVRRLVAAGLRTKDAVVRVADPAGVSRRDLYQAVVDARGNRP